MRRTLSLAAIAFTMAIAAPASADEGPSAEAPPAPAAPAAPVAATVDASAPAPARAPLREPIGTQRLLGAVAGALGFLTTAVGGFLVISSLNLYTEAKDRCRAKGCSTSDVDDGDKARSRANVGGIVLVSGLAVVGGGIALWFTAPKPGEKKSDTQVGLAPTLGGLSAVGTF